MQFKIDENIPPEFAELLRAMGHDALTIEDQGLRGSEDPAVISVCQTECRALVTLDLDFSDIRNYPPDQHNGIIVLRPFRQSRDRVLGLCHRILSLLDAEPITGHLWIVDEADVRIRGGER